MRLRPPPPEKLIGRGDEFQPPIQSLLEMTIGTIILDCASLEEPCAEVLDQIGRLKLAALKCNVDLRLDNANQRLTDLIELCGLAEVLRVEPRRQAE